MKEFAPGLDSDPVDVQILSDGSIALVTLNRPEERNPLDSRTLSDLHSQLIKLSSTDGVHGIVITGAGPAFSAGGDLKGYQKLFRDSQGFQSFMEEFNSICELLETCAQVTVAMVNGACVAGGLEIVLACDFATISEDASIGDGHMRFGQLPGAGGSQRLVRALGLQRAKYWLLSGNLFDAGEAVQAGLAIEAIPADQLLDRTLELTAAVAAHSALGRRRMKQLIRFAVDNHQSEGLRREMDLVLDYARSSHDAREGLNAFAEGREPRFRGH